MIENLVTLTNLASEQLRILVLCSRKLTETATKSEQPLDLAFLVSKDQSVMEPRDHIVTNLPLWLSVVRDAEEVRSAMQADLAGLHERGFGYSIDGQIFAESAIGALIDCCSATACNVGRRLGVLIVPIGIRSNEEAALLNVNPKIDRKAVMKNLPRVIEALTETDITRFARWQVDLRREAELLKTKAKETAKLAVEKPVAMPRPVIKLANEDRDKWLYKQCCKGIPYDSIKRDLDKRKKWEPLGNGRGVRKQAVRYADRKGLPPIPRRQNGRPKSE